MGAAGHRQRPPAGGGPNQLVNNAQWLRRPGRAGGPSAVEERAFGLCSVTHRAQKRRDRSSAGHPLKADPAAAHERVNRQAAHSRQLVKKLGDLLGEQVWTEAGLTFNSAINSSGSGCFVR